MSIGTELRTYIGMYMFHHNKFNQLSYALFANKNYGYRKGTCYL
jgi:hypothetical protein